MISSLIRFVVVFVAAAVMPLGVGASEVLAPKSSTQSGVTVKATPRNVAGEVWEFDIVLDTHSGELSDDLTKTVALITPEGELAPATWTGDPAGGHHRDVVLGFRAPSPVPPTIALRVIRPGEAQPRIFVWERK